MFQVYFEYIKNLVMKYIYCKYTLNLFLNIFFLMTQKYSWSGLTKFMYLLSNSEVYMKYIF